VDELRGRLEKVSGRRIRVNINEVRLPEVEAPLVARAVAEQIERRVSHRRAIKQAAMRAMQRGAQGVRIKISGRLGGSDMSRKDQERQGRVPLHTLKADVDYGTAEARTTLGRIGVKVWIYKGDKITERTAPPRSAVEKAEAGDQEQPAEAAAPVAEPAQPAAEAEAVAVDAAAVEAAPAEAPPAESAPAKAPARATRAKAAPAEPAPDEVAPAEEGGDASA
jgi:small subunit ribosomal protein S3